MGGGVAVPVVSFLPNFALVLCRHHTDSGRELLGRCAGTGTEGAAALPPAGNELRFLPGRCLWSLPLVDHRDRIRGVYRDCECL